MFGCVYFGELGFGQVWSFETTTFGGVVVGGDRMAHKVVGGDSAADGGVVVGGDRMGGLVAGGDHGG